MCLLTFGRSEIAKFQACPDESACYAGGVKLSVALLLIAAASGPRIVSAATVADPPQMQVEFPDDVCALAPRVGFPQCPPAPTDPTPGQLRSVAGKGQLLFFGKTGDASCSITLVKTPGFEPDPRAYERGARDAAKAQGGTVLELN